MPCAAPTLPMVTRSTAAGFLAADADNLVIFHQHFHIHELAHVVADLDIDLTLERALHDLRTDLELLRLLLLCESLCAVVRTLLALLAEVLLDGVQALDLLRRRVIGIGRAVLLQDAGSG